MFSSINLKYELEYSHNQNAMVLNFALITDSYFDLNINTSVSRMNYNFDNPSMSRFSINDFQMIVKDLGIINKTNLMLDINNISPINELFLESIAASGYLKEDLNASNATHAWVEIWLGDWVGIDVTNGGLVDDRFLVLAVGLDYLSVAPIRGVRYGGGEEKMTINIDIS